MPLKGKIGAKNFSLGGFSCALPTLKANELGNQGPLPIIWEITAGIREITPSRSTSAPA